MAVSSHHVDIWDWNMYLSYRKELRGAAQMPRKVLEKERSVRTISIKGQVLRGVARLGGGRARRVGREAVASVLNAVCPEVTGYINSA